MGEKMDKGHVSRVRASSGKAGGKARAASLSPERRSEIARNAANARWDARRESINTEANDTTGKLQDMSKVTPTVGLGTDEVIRGLKQGKLYARAGWNGILLQNVQPTSYLMFIFMVQGSKFDANRKPLSTIFGVGVPCTYNPHADMRARDGTISPWLMSQVDLFAEDWMEVSIESVRRNDEIARQSIEDLRKPVGDTRKSQDTKNSIEASWITHDGKSARNLLDSNLMIEARLRNGATVVAQYKDLCWINTGDPATLDIMAYRIITPPNIELKNAVDKRVSNSDPANTMSRKKIVESLAPKPLYRADPNSTYFVPTAFCIAKYADTHPSSYPYSGPSCDLANVPKGYLTSWPASLEAQAILMKLHAVNPTVNFGYIPYQPESNDAQ